MKKLRTILISGTGGLLGSELVKQLLVSPHNHIIALSSQVEEVKRVFGNHANLRILNNSNWANMVQKNEIEIFVNCAFPRSSDPEQLANGITFTENIMNQAIELGIKKIINISSQSVYSQKQKSLTDESAAVIPESLYGMTKYSTERTVALLCRLRDMKIHYSNIRLASLCGRALEVRMTNRFVKKALVGEPITINGGNQRISYLDVRDAAAALVAMINTDSSAWKPVYNLGNHDNKSVLELANYVKGAAKLHQISEVQIELLEGKDSFNNLIDSSLFYSDFNWTPKYTMYEMIDDLFDYYTLEEN